MKLKILDKNAHWWAKEKTNWAIQDKKGDWWLVGGSEFPEKKVDMKTNSKNKGMRSNNTDFKIMLFIAIGSFTGVSLAVLLFSLIS